MAVGVAVTGHGALGVVDRVEGGVPADGRFSAGHVAHVLHVALPRPTLVGELVGHCLHRFGIDAAGTDGLPNEQRARAEEVVEDLAVGLGLQVGTLAADHGDVVVGAGVADAVVLGQQRPFGGQGVSQIGIVGRRPERGAVPLVFQHDHEDVADLGGRSCSTWPGPASPRRPPTRPRRRWRGRRDDATRRENLTALLSAAVPAILLNSRRTLGEAVAECRLVGCPVPAPS